MQIENLAGKVIWEKIDIMSLRRADLRGADLRGADVAFSCWPLWCGSVGMIIDIKIARQLAAHFCAVECDDIEYQKVKAAILDFAQKSHIAKDLKI